MYITLIYKNTDPSIPKYYEILQKLPYKRL